MRGDSGGLGDSSCSEGLALVLPGSFPLQGLLGQAQATIFPASPGSVFPDTSWPLVVGQGL